MTRPQARSSEGREARSPGKQPGPGSASRRPPRAPGRPEAGRTARGGCLPAEEVRAAQGDPDKEAAGPPSTPPPAPGRTRGSSAPGPAAPDPGPRLRKAGRAASVSSPPRSPRLSRVPGSGGRPAAPGRTRSPGARAPPLPRGGPRAVPTIPRPPPPPPRARPAPRTRRRLLGPIVPRRLSRASRPPREPRRPQLTAVGSGKSRKTEASPGGLNPCRALPRGTGWTPRTPGSFSRGDSRLRTRGPVQGDWDGAGSDPSFPGPSSLESEHQLYGI